MHTVVVVALPDTVAFDLSIPVGVFDCARHPSGDPAYRVIVCGTEPVVRAGHFWIATDRRLDALEEADTIVVPGRSDIEAQTPTALIEGLRTALDMGTRIASICSGAFSLAAAGLLDGRRATTHWAVADSFRTAYPNVTLDADVLYVDDGQILTSAGASAGMDLCLHMVARDFGAAVAADAAKRSVAPLHRSGGQAQFIVRNPVPAHTIGQPQLTAHGADLDRAGSTPRHVVARRSPTYAAVSIRTLNRRFQSETGQTPMQWVTGVRVRHAQQLLETTDLGVETIGYRVGFGFRRQLPRPVPPPGRGVTATLPRDLPRPTRQLILRGPEQCPAPTGGSLSHLHGQFHHTIEHRSPGSTLAAPEAEALTPSAGALIVRRFRDMTAQWRDTGGPWQRGLWSFQRAPRALVEVMIQRYEHR